MVNKALLEKSLVDKEVYEDAYNETKGETKQTDYGEVSLRANVPETVLERENARRELADKTFEEEGLWDTFTNAVTADAGFNRLGDWAYTKYMESIANTGRDIDPTFDAIQAIKEDPFSFIPSQQQFLTKAVDAADFDNRKAMINERATQEAKLSAMGGYGEAMSFAAGAVDIDMFLPYMGTAKNLTRVKKLKGALKYANKDSEINNVKKTIIALQAKGAVNAAAQNVAVETFGALTGEDITVDDIVNAGMMGASFHAVLNTGANMLSSGKVNAEIKNKEIVDTLLERNGKLTWGQQIDILDQVRLEPEITVLNSVVRHRDKLYDTDDKGIVKRKNIRDVEPDAPNIVADIDAPDSLKDIIDTSYLTVKAQKDKQLAAYNIADENDLKLMNVSKEVIDAITGKDAYNEAWDSGNPVLAAFANDFVNDGSNFVSNINNAESFAYQVKQKQHSYMKNMEDHYSKWANEEIKQLTSKKDIWKARVFDNLRTEFNRELSLEVNNIDLGRAVQTNDPNMRAYIDELTKLSEYTLDELQDVAHLNTSAVAGSLDIPKNTHLSRVWNDYKVKQAMGELGEEAVIAAFTESVKRGYAAKELDLGDIKARAMAKAIVANLDRPTAQKQFSTKETKNQLYQLLDDNILLTDAEINSVIDDITKRDTERGKPSYTKHRIPMDYSVQLPDGRQIVDLLDDDINKNISRYVNNTSGRIGMARVGVTSDAIFNNIIDAAKLIDIKRKKLGETVKVDAEEYLNDMRSMLLGYPVGNVSAWAGRVTNFTNLFTMNAAGLTQNVEWAAQIGAMGVANTLASFSEVLKAAITKKNVGILEEIDNLIGVGFLDDFTTTAFNANNINIDNMPNSTKSMQTVDYLLRRGLSMQQTWNLMKPVMLAQRRTAIVSLCNQLYQVHIQGNFAEMRQRLSDWGIDEEGFTKISKELDKAVVEGGRLKNMNFAKWDKDTFSMFIRAANRAIDTLVQKPRLGESRRWQSSAAAKIIMQYQTYPLLAANKYFIRGTRHLDPSTLVTFMSSAMLGSLVYMAKVGLTTADPYERENKLQTNKIVYNALNYNAQIGFAMGGASMLSELVGVPLSPYAQGGNTNLTVPAAQLYNILTSPVKAASQKIIGGEVKRSTLQSLQSLSVMGRILGVSRMFEEVVDMPLSLDAKSLAIKDGVSFTTKSNRPSKEPRKPAKRDSVSVGGVVATKVNTPSPDTADELVELVD